MTGTAGLTTGVLNAVFPTSLTWSTALDGIDQALVDATAADQGYTVDDATTGTTGWLVTASATTFTCDTTSTPVACATTQTLPDSTFSTNGCTLTTQTGCGAGIAADVAPSDACSSGSTCTLPTNTVTTYPVTITTSATPSSFNIYGATAGTGKGSVDIGGSASANPVGWWLNVPGNTAPGTYTSTITLSVAATP